MAATAKTVLQILAPTNQRVKLLRYKFSFDGIFPTNEPVVVRLVTQTTAGTMTAFNASLQKSEPSLPETIQTTVTTNASAEPTTGNNYDSLNVHPQGGYAEFSGPGSEIIIAGGGRLGIVMTAPATVNVVVSVECEE